MDGRRLMIATLAGLGGLALSEAWARRRRAGLAPAFASEEIAHRLMRRAGAYHPPAIEREVGRLLSVGYSLLLSIPLAKLVSGDGPSRTAGRQEPDRPGWSGGPDVLLRAGAFTVLLWGTELLALPLLGATPSPRRWGPGEPLALLPHVASWTLPAAVALSLFEKK